MSVYLTTSTTTLLNAPTVDISDADYIITLDNKGFVGKTPLNVFKDFYQPQSLSSFTTLVNPNVLLGRYSPTIGGIEEIELGTGLSVTNGVLNCDVNFSGTAGGDLEGTFPNPTIKEGVITLNKFTGLNPGKLLGRYSDGIGGMEEISLSNDFIIDSGELKLVSTDNISSTGFIIESKNDDFIAEKTHLYFIESQKINLIITVNGNNSSLGDQFILINKGNSIITIEFPNDTIVLTKKFAYYVADSSANYYDIS